MSHPPHAHPHDWVVRLKGTHVELGRVHSQTWANARKTALHELARKLGRTVEPEEIDLEAVPR